MNLMFEPLRKYAQFTGRARRSEYWLFVLFVTVAPFVALFLTTFILGVLRAAGASEAALDTAFLWIAGLMILALLIPMVAVTVRRLHDIGASGWWILIQFVPLVGTLAFLCFVIPEGTRGPNRFGPDPKGGDQTAEVFA